MSGSSVFDGPARKMFLADLCQCRLMLIQPWSEYKVKMSGSSVFDCPARKMFLADLCQCRDLRVKSEATSPTTAQLKTWQSDCSGVQVTFSVVTVQGTVTQVNQVEDCMYIDDGTSVAMVKGSGKVPFCSVKPAKGQYLMIVAQLLTSGSLPSLRAIKLQDLTENIAMTTIWPLEVIDELAQLSRKVS